MDDGNGIGKASENHGRSGRQGGDRRIPGAAAGSADRPRGPVLRQVQLPGRVRLEVAEQGAPGGVPVVLLHGYTDSWRSYQLVLPHLPRWMRAFALSQRGHGESERPAGSYLTRDMADDVAAFLDGQGIERAIVVGHSMGSHVAQRFAMEHPDRLLGLALVGSFFDLAANAGVSELATAVRGLSDPVDPGFVRDFQVSTLAQPTPPGYLDAIVAESLKLPARVWQAVLDGLVVSGHRDRLAEIRTPTIVVWGDQDLFCPRSDQDAFLAAIPGSRLLAYQGAGHALHWEEPARFAADLATFVGTLVPGR